MLRGQCLLPVRLVDCASPPSPTNLAAVHAPAPVNGPLTSVLVTTFRTGRRAVTALEGEKKISAGALAQVEALNQQISALRRQLAAIEQALDASEQKNKESQSRITELGQRLNVALAQKVQE